MVPMVDNGYDVPVVMAWWHNASGQTVRVVHASHAQARVCIVHECHELTVPLTMTWDPRGILRICTECITKCTDEHTAKKRAVWSGLSNDVSNDV